MACDLCGAVGTALTDLLDCYKTSEVNSVCPACEKDLNRQVSKTRDVQQGLLRSMIRRYITNRVAERVERRACGVPSLRGPNVNEPPTYPRPPAPPVPPRPAGVGPSAVLIEVGQSYTTRNGATVRIAEAGVGCFYGDFGPGNQRRRYSPDGRYCGQGAQAVDPWDIVAGVGPSQPPSTMGRDQVWAAQRLSDPPAPGVGPSAPTDTKGGA